MASEAAKAVQSEREAAEMANHRERIVWLQGKQPCWSDGAPVDAHTRKVRLFGRKRGKLIEGETPLSVESDAVATDEFQFEGQ